MSSSAIHSFAQVYTISGTFAKLTYAVSETPAHNKWKPKTLNRASIEQEGLEKNNYFLDRKKRTLKKSQSKENPEKMVGKESK